MQSTQVGQIGQGGQGDKADDGNRGDRSSPADASSRLAADFSLLYQQTHASNVIDFHANEIFGEITRQAVTATVTSITYTDLLVLPARDFYRLLEQFPQLHETIFVCTGLQDGLLAEERRQKRSRASPAATGSASCHRQSTAPDIELGARSIQRAARAAACVCRFRRLFVCHFEAAWASTLTVHIYTI